MEKPKLFTTVEFSPGARVPRGEAPDYTGLDVIIVRDGRIAALYVFLNPKLL